MTPSGAGTKSGEDWANAMDWAARVAAPPVAGEVTAVKPGTYVMTGTVNFYSHISDPTSPVLFFGVKSGTTHEGAAITYSDWERNHANMPYIDGGAYSMICGGMVMMRNISFRSTDYYGLRFYGGHNQVLENCKVLNDSPTADQNALYAGGLYPRFINCDLSCPNGYIASQGSDHTFVYCYMHDSKRGVVNVTNIVAIYNIFKSLEKSFDSCDNPRIIGNTYYDCGESISPNGSIQTVLNNLIEGSTVAGIKASAQYDASLYWGNHGDDARNVDMWINVDTITCFQDYKVTAGDPKFQSPGTNFALQLGSPCARTSEDLFLGVGAVPSHSNKGAWQGPEIDPAIAAWPLEAEVDPLADPFGPNGNNYTPAMDVPDQDEVDPLSSLRGLPGTMDVPDQDEVDPLATLRGVAGDMDVPAQSDVLARATLRGLAGTGPTDSQILVAGSGNYVPTATFNVKKDITFGPNASLIGTLKGGSGTMFTATIPGVTGTVTVVAINIYNGDTTMVYITQDGKLMSKVGESIQELASNVGGL
jgi:hypothetical protein